MYKNIQLLLLQLFCNFIAVLKLKSSIKKKYKLIIILFNYFFKLKTRKFCGN